MGEQEINICSGCKEEEVVSRKYFYYDIKCDCCNSKNDPHFEIVYHCKNCVPFPPKQLNVYLEPMKEFRHLLSERIINSLDTYSFAYKCDSFNTIEDLRNLSLIKLSYIRGFGNKRMNELKQFLTRYRIECKH